MCAYPIVVPRAAPTMCGSQTAIESSSSTTTTIITATTTTSSSSFSSSSSVADATGVV